MDVAAKKCCSLHHPVIRGTWKIHQNPLGLIHMGVGHAQETAGGRCGQHAASRSQHGPIWKSVDQQRFFLEFGDHKFTYQLYEYILIYLELTSLSIIAMVENIYIYILSYYHMIQSISMELEYQSSNQRALGAMALQSVDSKSSSLISTGHMGVSIVMGLPQASLGWWKIHGTSQSFLCMMTGISTLQGLIIPSKSPNCPLPPVVISEPSKATVFTVSDRCLCHEIWFKSRIAYKWFNIHQPTILEQFNYPVVTNINEPWNVATTDWGQSLQVSNAPLTLVVWCCLLGVSK